MTIGPKSKSSGSGDSAEVFRLLSDRLRWRETEGEAIMLDLETSTYLAANETASTLWPLLEQGASREALVAELTRIYEIDVQTAEADVDDFLGELKARGLLDER